MFDGIKSKAKEDPLTVGFLGLTVAALIGGLGSLYTDNKRQSQIMMRARVGFQFMTVACLVGGIYWKAYKGTLGNGPRNPTTDNRVYLNDPRLLDLQMAAAVEAGKQPGVAVPAAKAAAAPSGPLGVAVSPVKEDDGAPLR